jgi:hypothetical protein
LFSLENGQLHYDAIVHKEDEPYLEQFEEEEVEEEEA